MSHTDFGAPVMTALTVSVSFGSTQIAHYGLNISFYTLVMALKVATRDLYQRLWRLSRQTGMSVCLKA